MHGFELLEKKDKKLLIKLSVILSWFAFATVELPTINMHFWWGVGFLSKNQSYTISCDRLENLSLLFTIGKSKNGKGEVGVPNSPLSQFALGFPSSLVTQNP